MKKFLKYGYSCHNVEQAISVGKMALKDLLDARLPQTFICKKKKKARAKPQNNSIYKAQ